MSGTAVTSEVVLSMLITSLPVGGMITRIACGNTFRRIVCAHDMPERDRGLGLALADRADAGPDDLGHVGGLVQRRGRCTANKNAASMPCRLKCANCGPNGIPRSMLLVDRARTGPRTPAGRSTGVPRKIHRYTHADPLSTGFGDSRITASMTPSTIAEEHRQHGQLERDDRRLRDSLVEQVLPVGAQSKASFVAAP